MTIHIVLFLYQSAILHNAMTSSGDIILWFWIKLHTFLTMKQFD